MNNQMNYFKIGVKNGAQNQTVLGNKSPSMGQHIQQEDQQQ